MGKELELKYKIDGQTQYVSVRALLEERYPGGWKKMTMTTDYYDTADRLLVKRHWTLRIRTENGVNVLTCKTPAADGSRNEWEIHEGTLPDGLVALVRLGAPEELMELLEAPLRPVCGARFTRHRRILNLNGAKAELALDKGALLGGGKELPFWELELELMEGDPRSIDRWCADFARENRLFPEPRSKFARAFSLDGE